MKMMFNELRDFMKEEPIDFWGSIVVVLFGFLFAIIMMNLFG